MNRFMQLNGRGGFRNVSKKLELQKNMPEFSVDLCNLKMMSVGKTCYNGAYFLQRNVSYGDDSKFTSTVRLKVRQR